MRQREPCRSYSADSAYILISSTSSNQHPTDESIEILRQRDADANGNTLTGGGRTNTWDGQNRLTQCVYNSTTTTHTYGADGLRRGAKRGNEWLNSDWLHP
jgi:hypothetical protein